jgi:predicted DNA binding protein
MGRGQQADPPDSRNLGPDSASDKDHRTPLTCRLRVTLPNSSWMGRLTARHSDVRIEVLDRLPLPSRRMLTVIRLPTSSQPDWAATIRRFPGVNYVQRLDQGPGMATYRVTARAPVYLPLFQKLRITGRYPFWVEHGAVTWVVTGSRTQIRALLSGLRARVPDVVLEEIRPGSASLSRAGLTLRQREVVRSAVAGGYYDVPRGVSLTTLALRLQISKSTLSKMLAVAEGKILFASWPGIVQNGLL